MADRGPDVRQLTPQTLPQAPFPAPSGEAFRIFIEPNVHRAIHDHARADTSVEICGVLVGELRADADGPYVAVTASIPGEAATSKFAEVTFTHETWARINSVMDQQYADRTIVGWYHTHPDFGIFLSDRDLFIHEHFFNGPGQIALVIDPIRKIEGIFVWRNGKTKLAPRYWIGEQWRVTSDPGDAAPSHHGGEITKVGAATAAAIEPPAAPPPREPIVTNTLMLLLMMVCSILVGYLYGGRQTDADRVLWQQGLAVYFTQTKVLKIGLTQAMTSVSDQIDEVRRTVAMLATAAPPKDDDSRAQREQNWQSLRARLMRISQEINQIAQTYGLSPQETEAIEKQYERLAPMIDLKKELPTTTPEKSKDQSSDKKAIAPDQADKSVSSTKPAPPAKTPESKP